MFLVHWLREISPNLCWKCLQQYDYFIKFIKSVVSTLFSGPNFPRPEPSMFADVWLFLSILWYSYLLFTAISLGGNFPRLSFLYLQFHNYFFPFSKYLSCVIFSFFKFTIISFQLIVTFSLFIGEISPEQSDVSSLFTGGNFPPFHWGKFPPM